MDRKHLELKIENDESVYDELPEQFIEERKDKFRKMMVRVMSKLL